MSDKLDLQRCVRIEFEYADGTIYRLEGSEANRWMGVLTAALDMHQIHGAKITSPTFEKIHKEP